MFLMFLKRYLFIYLSILVPSLLEARPTESHKFAISSSSTYIQDAALRIHNQGGNVVDMAVASALVLSVTTPYYVSLGAGGFALVDMGHQIQALDFREVAPQKSQENYFKDKSSVIGGSAVGVPGFVAGLWSLHKKYGVLKWKTLFKEAIQLAQKGYLVSGEWAEITRNIPEFRYGMRSFFKKNAMAYKPGERIKQPQLAEALRLVRDQKRDGFYKGPVAQDVVRSVQKFGGHMTMEDLKSYETRWLKPVYKGFKGYGIYIMPPPSSGGIVISTALDLISKKKLFQHKPMSLPETHLLGEIMARSFRGRSFIADPSFYNIPYKKIMSRAYINKQSESISKKKVLKMPPLKETTHLVVMDHQGRTVSMTLTLNLQYGSKAVTSQYGIVLNNQMDDFTTHLNKPNSFGLIQGVGNKVEPRKRPMSSMSPTIVKRKGKTIMSLGGAGGPRIISGVLQVMYRVLLNEMDIDQAIQYPRIHHQFLPHQLFLEENRWSPLLIRSLERKGHHIRYVKSLGKVYGIFRTKKGILKSAFDSRGDGLAFGI